MLPMSDSGDPDLGFLPEHLSKGNGSCKNDALDKENNAKRRRHRPHRFSPAATHPQLAKISDEASKDDAFHKVTRRQATPPSSARKEAEARLSPAAPSSQARRRLDLHRRSRRISRSAAQPKADHLWRRKWPPPPYPELLPQVTS